MLYSIILASDLASNPNGLLEPLRSLLVALLQRGLDASGEESPQKVASLIGACMKAISGLLMHNPSATMDSNTTVMIEALLRFPHNAAILSAFHCYLTALKR